MAFLRHYTATCEHKHCHEEITVRAIGPNTGADMMAKDGWQVWRKYSNGWEEAPSHKWTTYCPTHHRKRGFAYDHTPPEEP